MPRRGCLSLLMPVRDTKRLPVRLPTLDTSKVHPTDRAAMRRAEIAAEKALSALSGPNTPEIALRDLAEQLSNLLGAVHRLAASLGSARRFLESNSPDSIAREKTDLELRRLGASASEILALRAASDALANRSALTERVRSEIGTLEARLISAGQELEAFRARAEASAGAEALGHELGAYLRSAELALQAFERTRAEMGG